MTTRIGINGFGRIGRAAFRIIQDEYQGELEVVKINDLTDNETLAYLMKYDTAYGQFGHEVEFDESSISVDGRRIEVALPEELVAAGPAKRKPKKRRAGKAAVSGDAVASPMQGSVIKVNVSEGDEVAEGDVLLVLEAMKMENPVKAHKAGTVTGLAAEAGGQVTKGAVLMELK